MSTSNIFEANIENELNRSYANYSTNAMIGLGLYDIRYKLRALHRRVPYAMPELEND